MSDHNSPQYDAIRSLYPDLVEAVSSEIDNLIQMAWSRKLIGKQQLNISLEPSNTAHLKASSFVSAIATRVGLDKKAFDQFVSLLRVVQSLDYLANRLEQRLHKSSMPASAGVSVSPSSSPANNRRPPNEMPKLDIAEDESGFVDGGQDVGAIAKDPGSQLLFGGDTEFLAHDIGGVSRHEEDENLTVGSYKDDEEEVSQCQISEVGENGAQQELVTEKLLSSKEETDSATSSSHIAPVVFSVGPSRSQELIEAKLQVSDLEAELSEKNVETQKLQEKLDKVIQEKSETEVKLMKAEKMFENLSAAKDFEVAKLKKSVESYKIKLSNKENENKHLREEYEAKIKSLKDELNEKEEKYGKEVLELTKGKHSLELELKKQEVEVEKLKRQISEAKQETLLLRAQVLSDENCKLKREQESSQIMLQNMKKEQQKEKADSDSKIQQLEHLLSQASLSSQAHDSTVDGSTG